MKKRNYREWKVNLALFDPVPFEQRIIPDMMVRVRRRHGHWVVVAPPPGLWASTGPQVEDPKNPWTEEQLQQFRDDNRDDLNRLLVYIKEKNNRIPFRARLEVGELLDTKEMTLRYAACRNLMDHVESTEGREWLGAASTLLRELVKKPSIVGMGGDAAPSTLVSRYAAEDAEAVKAAGDLDNPRATRLRRSPTPRKGEWTPDEDVILVKYFSAPGFNHDKRKPLAENVMKMVRVALPNRTLPAIRRRVSLLNTLLRKGLGTSDADKVPPCFFGARAAVLAGKESVVIMYRRYALGAKIRPRGFVRKTKKEPKTKRNTWVKEVARLDAMVLSLQGELENLKIQLKTQVP